MSQNLNGNKIEFIESMRGIAAMMVVLFHFISFKGIDGFIIQNESVRKISEFGAQGVELFFMISGFVIFLSLRKANYNYKNLWQYLKKRIIRIIPLYWAVIILTQIVSFCIGYFLWKINMLNSWQDIITSATFTSDLFSNAEWINPVFKTLGLEFIFYIIVGFTFPILKNKLVRYIVFLSIILLSLSHEFRGTLWYAPYFITGITLLDLHENKKDWLGWGFLLLLVNLFIFRYNTEDLLIASLGILCFLFKIPNFKLGNFLGKISYSIYLIHGVTGGWVLFFLCQSGALPNWVNIGLAIGFTIICSWITYYLIENPSTYLSRRIKYKK